MATTQYLTKHRDFFIKELTRDTINETLEAWIEDNKMEAYVDYTSELENRVYINHGESLGGWPIYILTSVIFEVFNKNLLVRERDGQLIIVIW